MSTSNRRVTARVVRTPAGETRTEYYVDGAGYGSLDELKRATGGL